MPGPAWRARNRMTLKIKVSYEPGITLVRLGGPIDEHMGEALEDLRSQVKTPRVIFDTEQVSLINSIGAARWMAHMREYAGVEVSFIKCPAAFTSLCLMMPDLVGEGRIESLYAHYYCPSCDDELKDQLIHRAEISVDRATGRATFPTRSCPSCKTAMNVDPDDEDFQDLLQDAS
jgi:hypothetical protein